MNCIIASFVYGPDDRIRTCGILLPKQALYQTEPHPVTWLLYTLLTEKAITNCKQRKTPGSGYSPVFLLHRKVTR